MKTYFWIAANILIATVVAILGNIVANLINPDAISNNLYQVGVVISLFISSLFVAFLFRVKSQQSLFNSEPLSVELELDEQINKNTKYIVQQIYNIPYPLLYMILLFASAAIIVSAFTLGHLYIEIPISNTNGGIYITGQPTNHQENGISELTSNGFLASDPDYNAPLMSGQVYIVFLTVGIILLLLTIYIVIYRKSERVINE